MPEWRDEIRGLLTGLRLSPTRQAEITEELEQHLEDRYRDLVGSGCPPADARRRVLEEIGDGAALSRALAGVERAEPEPVPLGAGRPLDRIGRIGQDLRFGLRMLRSRPLFALVAGLTLALGIGATTAIFSVVNAVLLRSLPYPEADRLVSFWGTAPEKNLPVVDFPDALLVFYQAQSRRFESVAGYRAGGINLSGDGEPERVNFAAVTPNFFQVMQVGPVRGRAFSAEEGTAGHNQVAVLSHRLWQRRFGQDPAVVGRTVTISGTSMVVVGVMPPGFDFPSRSEIWLPLVLNPESLSYWSRSAVGRLREGQTVLEAQQEIAGLTDEFMLRRPARFPDAKRGGARIVAQPLHASLVGELQTPLVVLFGAVGLVLLIAAANIANLMLARAAARTREMAVRCCLGAGPGRIAAQLFTESLLLALGGAAGGVLLAFGGIRLLHGLPPDSVPGLERVSVDPPVLLFAIAITLVTALLFGLAPAVRASRVELQDALREGTRGGTATSSRRLTNGFVVVQFALALILLVGAGLLLRSFRNLLEVDPGFRAEHVLLGRIQLPGRTYDDEVKIARFYGSLLESVRAMPGVIAAGLNEQVPFTPGNTQQELFVEGQEPARGDAIPVINTRSVSPGYFEAIGTPILRGRGFRESDDLTTPFVVVVDETVARRYWPGGDPLGKRIRTSNDSTAQWMTIVGVTPNVKHASLSERPDFQLYQPFAQWSRWSSYLVVRTASAPEALVTLIRRRVAALDPTLPFSEVQTLEQAVASSLATRRLTNVLLTGFALLALLLSALGIYGVMSLNVAGRLNEFGVRLALGAAPGDLLRQVLGQGLALALLGLGLGLAGALGLTRFLRTLLFEVQPIDPVTFAIVASTLAAAAVLACYVPARRATKSDPITILRRE